LLRGQVEDPQRVWRGNGKGGRASTQSREYEVVLIRVAQHAHLITAKIRSRISSGFGHFDAVEGQTHDCRVRKTGCRWLPKEAVASYGHFRPIRGKGKVAATGKSGNAMHCDDSVGVRIDTDQS
jgi:hypothetical protein